MSEAAGNGQAKGFWTAVRFVLRLLAVAVVGLLIGVGAYAVGVWTVNEVVTPIEEHSASLERPADRTDAQRQELEDLGDRVADLESATSGELTRIHERADELAEQLTGLQDSLAKQESRMADLASVESDLVDLQRIAQDLQGQIGTMEGQQEADRLSVSQLEARLTFMRVMVILSRADSLIARNELTAAEDALGTALLELAELPETDDADQQALIENLNERLGLALEAIHAQPEVASLDLDAAWALLAGSQQE